MNGSEFQRAILSLQGLSVGDAFGEQFFRPAVELDALFTTRVLPAPPWPYTDDTEMALSIVQVLRHYHRIDQVHLAHAFATHYDSQRGYGPAMHRVLTAIQTGEPWQSITRSAFSGMGSWGNGAAMRAGPIGAYFADNLHHVVEQAALSAEVTHAHPEAIAGAIGVAAAAAIAWQNRTVPLSPSAFLDCVLPLIPPSEVHDTVRKARDLPGGSSVRFAVRVLGNGVGLSAQDTVPFALWCAAHKLDTFEEALWLTASGEGDRDTTCAIVGSIVVLTTGIEGIPQPWLAAREPLPAWPFKDAP